MTNFSFHDEIFLGIIATSIDLTEYRCCPRILHRGEGKMTFKKSVMAICATFVLAGCEGAAGFGNRYGPSPEMPRLLVEASTSHQDYIMTKLASAAHCDASLVGDQECFYRTTLVGFNFVDEQCDAYLRELYALDKERDRANNAITSAGLLTNAVLAVSPASKVTMAIVAQAFGLSASYIDIATDSYLYKTDSGVIYSIVSSLQAQYRDNAFNNKELINSFPESYGFIRGYLRLCMPPMIESKITTALAKAKAEPPPEDQKKPEEETSENQKKSGPGTIQNVELGTN